eukprot:13734624-Alexandrium_andersonii.AAC.1
MLKVSSVQQELVDNMHRIVASRLERKICVRPPGDLRERNLRSLDLIFDLTAEHHKRHGKRGARIVRPQS